MLVAQKIGQLLSRYQLLLGLLALIGISALSFWLRQRDFSSGFVLFCYLEIVGSLLCFTFVANALVHFRGTRDRLTLVLALGFLLVIGILPLVYGQFLLSFASGLRFTR